MQTNSLFKDVDITIFSLFEEFKFTLCALIDRVYLDIF